MMGTNAPGRPSCEGQICVFQSPHADVLLADRAEVDRYGKLRWAALQPDDPSALEAIIAHQVTTN